VATQAATRIWRFVIHVSSIYTSVTRAGFNAAFDLRLH
jgi:hypothetical protein